MYVCVLFNLLVEVGNLHQLIFQLKKYAKDTGYSRSNITFLDIGGNVGWFTTAIAMRGFRVITFEPMPRNEIILRSNLCINNLTSLVTLFNTALSNTSDNCKIVSETFNRGNGVIICGDDKVNPTNYVGNAKKEYSNRYIHIYI